MNTMKLVSKSGLGVGVVSLAMLTGCATYVEEPHYRSGQAYHPRERVVVVQDDYVYYPDYEVYYSSNRRQYIYLDGGTWVERSAPPRVSANVLVRSPSVRLDFHDEPSRHHSQVVKKYPGRRSDSRSSGNERDHGKGNKYGKH